jgi:AcrR family transcriptional regulator
VEHKTYHHGDLKKALIEAGLEIIMREGIDNLSMRAVSKKIGVSHAALYRHFKGKKELVVAIALAGFQMLDSKLSTTNRKSGTDPLTQLAAGSKAYIAFAVAHPDYYRIMFREHIRNKTDYPELFEAFDKLFKQTVGIIINYKAERGVDAEITAVAIWSLLHGYASLIIDNLKDPTVGSKMQIDLLLKKMLALVN